MTIGQLEMFQPREAGSRIVIQHVSEAASNGNAPANVPLVGQQEHFRYMFTTNEQVSAEVC